MARHSMCARSLHKIKKEGREGSSIELHKEKRWEIKACWRIYSARVTVASRRVCQILGEAWWWRDFGIYRREACGVNSDFGDSHAAIPSSKSIALIL